MGTKALHVKEATLRSIRNVGPSDDERSVLRAKAAYEGSPHHKRNPGNFGLTPPAAPRPDKRMAIVAATEHFEVSERLILSTLVNWGKIPRSRLQE